MVLVWDTETTGLPKNYKAKVSDLENWPRIIQLAWSLSDPITGDLIKEKEYLIKPDGWVVPAEKFWIDNGFSTEECELNGTPMPVVLDELIGDMHRCRVLVGHNNSFDSSIIGAEFIRYKRSVGRVIPKRCTKEEGTKFCNIPGAYGRPKWPTLMELHVRLFGKPFEGAHDALSDVTACRLCFHEMIKRKIIKP